jgi:TolB-like protein/class 3 adenylate cyclase
MPTQTHQQTTTRRLAAIMFTDIVGYTALMGKNSVRALELVRISKDIQKPLVENHYGKWLKEMGDGALAQFDSALDAVNCAVEIQELARAKFDGKLRIGIHLGDVTVEDGDVYGDGVNVASRLESIADPGGIYISESIEKAIHGQTDIQAKYLGELSLKNVDYGVRTYSLQGVGLPVPDLKGQKELSGRFVAELQRRGVIRVAISYLVVSLLLLLLHGYVKELMSLPSWSFSGLLAGLCILCPIALYLAWSYERSPAGYVKTTSRQSWENPLTPAQRKPLTNNFIIIMLLVVIAGMYFVPKILSNVLTSSIDNISTTGIDQSIAVLPFMDMSPNKDQEYFSDGMMEEILNHLYKIGDLSVTSRTSTMRYKNTTKSIPEIGRELGVAHILEGSVRKSENDVRITVQLINVAEDAHIWAENYDRKLDNVFAIQSEVAMKIAEVLKAEIRPEVEQIMESVPTENTEAYNLFLQARSKNTYDVDENAEAIKLLHEATKLDPNFGRAYLDIGIRLQVGATVYSTGEGMDPTEAWVISKPYMQKAIDLEPDYAMAHLRMAWSLLWFEWDFEKAEREYLEAKRIFPNYSWTDYLVAIGRFNEALAGAKKSVDVDPRSPTAWQGKILSQYFAGHHDEALKTIDYAINDTTIRGQALVVSSAIRMWVYMGKYEKAITNMENLMTAYPDIESSRLFALLWIAYHHTDQLDKAEGILNRMIEKSKINAGGSPSFYIAIVYSQLGEIDNAFQWLEKSYQDREVELHWLKVEPPFEPIRSDPRYQAMLDKVGFPKD